MSKLCRNCDSNRILCVGGKVSDMYYHKYKDKEYDGYVPEGLGIGGGDYISFNYCLDCGQIQGIFPVELDPFVFDDDNCEDPFEID
jgi:hypothetical protein